jgi:mRNA interferase MazF
MNKGQRGEVWLVDLDPTQGSEMQKRRPCVVISADYLSSLPLRVVVPITSWKSSFEGKPWFVRLRPDESNQLDKLSAADGLQVRCLDESRLMNRIGTVSQQDLEDIIAAVCIVIGAV